ncbi:PEP-CTERM sorting domain-containing protein [Colwellia sp. UCD-KL20]|uniref:PEP-CTERM sorting domain-containing protein n=1 Tax=Colwellia sp. UCD-KL20 TaxID=1917165 RepID=UPI0009703A78|nr:PEP-CTERM sorting domain-containing protein [Colwellia sp. UCD-KL20]
MKFKVFNTTFASMLFIASCISTSANAGLITVNDATNLDFSGDFVYAVNFAGPSGVKVGDAVFTNMIANGTGSTTGVSVSGFNRNLTWAGASNLGGGTNNDGLEQVMRSIIWSSGLNPGMFDIAVVANTNYRLQLLFSEGCCSNRHFDINTESGTLHEEVKGTSLGGTVWAASQTKGYAMSVDFLATDNNLDIDLMRLPSGDSNYLISGFTLEKLSKTSVPEPSTLAIFTLAILGLVSRKLKKS